MERADLARHQDTGSMPVAPVAEAWPRYCSNRLTGCGGPVTAAAIAAPSVVGGLIAAACAGQLHVRSESATGRTGQVLLVARAVRKPGSAHLILWYVASSKTFCTSPSVLSLYTVCRAPLLPSQLRACITSLLLWLQ